jgi:hypothetical protein
VVAHLGEEGGEEGGEGWGEVRGGVVGVRTHSMVERKVGWGKLRCRAATLDRPVLCWLYEGNALEAGPNTANTTIQQKPPPPSVPPPPSPAPCAA